MKIIKEDDAIWNAIDKGGGQTVDIIGVIRELDKAGYFIVSKADYKSWFEHDTNPEMKAELGD